MNIVHDHLFHIEAIIEHYTKKDGVDVKYVCTTDLNASDVPVDVFYRETPHPQFGNRYFGLYWDTVRNNLMITNADIVESLEFGMIEVDGKYYYSQSHHDYKVVEGKMIDGGRAYIRSNGGAVAMHIKDGKFYIKELEDMIEYYQPGQDCQV